MTADSILEAVGSAQEKHRPLTAGWPGGYHCSACEWEDRALLWDRHMREVGVDAARPLIEAQLRERLAAAIDKEATIAADHDAETCGVCTGSLLGFAAAARIVRERP